MITDEVVGIAEAASKTTRPTGDGTYMKRSTRTLLEAAEPHIIGEALSAVSAQLDEAERLCEANGIGKEFAVVSVQQIRDLISGVPK